MIGGGASFTGQKAKPRPPAQHEHVSWEYTGQVNKEGLAESLNPREASAKADRLRGYT